MPSENDGQTDRTQDVLRSLTEAGEEFHRQQVEEAFDEAG